MLMMIALLWQNGTHIQKLAEMQTNKQALTFIGSQLKMMLVVGSLTLDSQNSEFIRTPLHLSWEEETPEKYGTKHTK